MHIKKNKHVNLTSGKSGMIVSLRGWGVYERFFDSNVRTDNE